MSKSHWDKIERRVKDNGRLNAAEFGRGVDAALARRGIFKRTHEEQRQIEFRKSCAKKARP